MTREELDTALLELDLKVPDTECREILAAIKFVEKLRSLVRKTSSVLVEPAHTISFPELKL